MKFRPRVKVHVSRVIKRELFALPGHLDRVGKPGIKVERRDVADLLRRAEAKRKLASARDEAKSASRIERERVQRESRHKVQRDNAERLREQREKNSRIEANRRLMAVLEEKRLLRAAANRGSAHLKAARLAAAAALREPVLTGAERVAASRREKSVSRAEARPAGAVPCVDRSEFKKPARDGHGGVVSNHKRRFIPFCD